MLIARNLEYLSEVQSTIRYSRKLAALGRLSAGVAHEVKNPLNAMMIHLELLRQQFAAVRPARAAVAGGGRAVVAAVSAAPVTVEPAQALQHLDIISSEIKRLDEVVQGFLKFTRPEDLKLQPVQLSALFDEIVPIVRPEADALRRRADRGQRKGARRERRSGDAAAGVPEPRAQRLSGDAGRRHAANHAARGCAAATSRSRSPTRESASSRSICSAYSTCISRRKRRGAESACRWSTARFRCTMAISKCNRRPDRERRFASCCRRHSVMDEMHRAELDPRDRPGRARRAVARSRLCAARCWSAGWV